MGRIRTLKPEFFSDVHLSRCSIPARVTFAGLWTEADDFGRGPANPRILKGRLWALDDAITPAVVAGHLRELAAYGRIIRYEVDGEEFYEIPSWEQHQAASYRRGKALFPERPPTPEPARAEVQHVADACKEVQESAGTWNVEGNVERGTSAPARARDPIWDAVMDCWQIAQHELSPTERGRLNKACADLRAAKANPDEIPRRRAVYRRRYPNAADTPIAIAGRWAELRSDQNGQTPTMPVGADVIQRAVARREQ